MSRKAINLIAAAVAMTMVIGCSSGSGGSAAPATGGGTQQAAASQQPAAATQLPSAATQQSAAPAPQACTVLTKDQVGTEFGATFPDGTLDTIAPPMGATSSSACKFHTNAAVGKPWTITIYVFGFPSDTAAGAQMTEYRRTTLSTGAVNWAIVELPGLGDDAIYHNLLSLHDNQEEVITRKGSTIYWLLDTMVTGIGDVIAARNHLVALATLAIGR